MFRTESGHLCRYGMLDGRIFEALPERIPSKQVLPDPGIRGLVAAYGKQVLQSYRFPMQKIVISEWLQQIVCEMEGGEIAN